MFKPFFLKKSFFFCIKTVFPANLFTEKQMINAHQVQTMEKMIGG